MSRIEVNGYCCIQTPIISFNVNNIRGVAEQVMNTLSQKGVIEEVELAPTPGNPALYGITNKFYDYFVIRTMGDLPKLM